MSESSAADFNDDPVPESLRVPSGAELIANDLRRRIVRGELEEGSVFPPENRLRTRYGVSGPTLRSAFRVLEAEGLIEVKRGSRGGASVRRPTPSVASRYVGTILQAEGTSLADLFQARVVLEPALAAAAADRMGPEEVVRLNELVEAEEKVLADGSAFARATSRFHRELIGLSGNRTAAVLADLLWNLFELQTARAVARSGDNPEQIQRRRAAVHAHQRLIELLVRQDREAILTFWRDHMSAVGRLLASQDGSEALLELFE